MNLLSGGESFWQTVGGLPEMSVRACTVLVLASASLAPVSLMAQVQGAPQTAQGNAPRVHVEDGGVTEMMESIVVLPSRRRPSR